MRKYLRPISSGVLLVAATAVFAAIFQPWLDTGATTMVFLVPVLWTAIRLGRTASLAVAAVAAAVNNFFFFEPVFAFGLLTVHDAVVLFMFLLVAFTTATLAARARAQADMHRQRSEELAALFALSQEIDAAPDLADLVTRLQESIARQLGVRVRIDLGAGHCPGTTDLAIPLRARDRDAGSMVIEGGPHLTDPSRGKLLSTVADLVAMAIENAHLRSEMNEARVLAETERFRSALLSSVTHDFRTPIAGIMGATTTLLLPDVGIDDAGRRNLLNSVLRSACRLDRYVRNLLDITAIDAGAVAPDRQWHEIEDVIGAALNAMESALADRPIQLDIDPAPMLRLDICLTERVLMNLLENAVKYSPPLSPIEVLARHKGDAVLVAVFSQSETPPPTPLERLFERFYRGGTDTIGHGLGLAICRGFMAAQGGSIVAEWDAERHGLRFVLAFPVEPLPQLLERGANA